MDRHNRDRRMFGQGLRRTAAQLAREAGRAGGAIRRGQLVEGLESRVMLAGFSPAGSAIGDQNVMNPMLEASDVSFIDINGDGAGQYDRVRFSGSAALDGILHLRFGDGLTLEAGDTFEILSRSAGTGAITGAFRAIYGWTGPAGSALDLVAIQGPQSLRLVATDLPVQNFTIATTTQAEADSLVALFAGGSADMLDDSEAVNGTLHAIDQRISGRLTFQEVDEGGEAGVNLSLGPRGPQASDLGRITINLQGFDAASVFGSGEFTLRGSADPDTAGLRMSSFTPSGFTLAPGFGDVDTPTTNLIVNGRIGPLKFTRLEATAPAFVLTTNSSGHDEVDVEVGFTAQKFEFMFTNSEGNPGGVKAEVLLVDRLSVGFEATFDGSSISEGTASGAFHLEARRFELEVPNVLKVSTSAGFVVRYDPDDMSPDQTLLEITTISAEIPKLHLKASFDSPQDQTTQGLIVRKNGFRLGQVDIILDTSSFGGQDSMADGQGFLRIGNAMRVMNPRLRANLLEMTFNPDGSVATTTLDAVGVGADSLRIGPDGSMFYAESQNLTIDVTFPNDDPTQVPDGVRIRADQISFHIGDFVTLSGTNIRIDTSVGPSERMIIVDGNLSATLNLGELTGNPSSGLMLTGSAGGFAIKGDGTFEPFTNTSEPPFNTNPFHVSLQVTADNIGALLSGVQFPSFLSNFTNFSASVELRWPNLTSDPGRFLMLLSLSLAGSFQTVSFSFAMENLVVDTARMLATPPKFPIISLGSVTGTLNATIAGIGFNGAIIIGVAKFDDQGQALSDEQVLANPDIVGQSVVYAGARGGVQIAGYGAELMFGFSELGFLQAYFFADVPVLLDYHTGLTISEFRGGLTFNATPFPAITDPFLLRNPLFKPARSLTPAQWEAQLGLLVANQVGGNPGFLFKITDAQIRSRYPQDEGLDGWLNQLDSTDDPGLVLPNGLRQELLQQGFSFTTKAGQATTIQLDAADLWLLNDRGQEFLIQRNRSDNSLSVYSIGFSISDDTDSDTDAFSALTAVDAETTAGAVAGIIEAFQEKGIAIAPSAIVRVLDAGRVWEIDDAGVKFRLERRGLVGAPGDSGEEALIVTGGNGAFGTSSTTRIEAGFTLYSQYTTESSFNIKADAIVSIDGKFLISGDMVFGENPSQGGTSRPIAIEAKMFFDLSQLQAGTAQILFLGDLRIAGNTIPAISVFGRFTMAFYVRSDIPGVPDTLVDTDYIASTVGDFNNDQQINILDLVQGPEATRPDYFKVELAGSETQGIALLDAAGIPGFSSFAVQRFRLGGKSIDGTQTYGYAALSFDFTEIRLLFEFNANFSAEGLIAADSIVKAAGKFELDFSLDPDGTPRFEYLYGAAKLEATAQDIEPLKLAGIDGGFNATLKINTSNQVRQVTLPGFMEPLNLRAQSFGLFADARLVFKPPVVGGFLHQEIVGAFALEIDPNGFQLFILGSAPVPLPVVGAALSPLQAHVLGVMLFRRNGSKFDFAGRLEMAIADDLNAGTESYFNLQMDLQLFLNTSGVAQTYTLPEDFGERFTSSIPDALRARLDPNGDGTNDALSITVPAGAPRLGWSPSNPVTDPAGIYIAILGSGDLIISDPGTFGAGLSIDTNLRIVFGTSGFSLDIDGTVVLAPLGALTARGSLTIEPTTPGGFDYQAWGSFQLATQFGVGPVQLFAGASIDINTYNGVKNVKHFYNPATGTVITDPAQAITVPLNGPALQIYAGGYLRWNSTDLVRGEFRFMADSAGLLMTANGVLNLGPLVNASIDGGLLLGSDGNVLGALQVRSNISLGILTFAGSIDLQFNTFNTTRDVAGVSVPGNSFQLYVDGSLSLGGVFTLSGTFRLTDNADKFSVLIAADIGLFGLSVHVGGSADLYKGTGGTSPGLVLDVGVTMAPITVSPVFNLTTSGVFLRINTRNVDTMSSLGNNLAAGLKQFHIGSISMTLLSAATFTGSATITTVNSIYGNWKIAGNLSLRLFSVFNVSASGEFYDSGAFRFDTSLHLQLGPDEFNIRGDMSLHASYLHDNSAPGDTNLTRSDLRISGSGSLSVNVEVEIEVDAGLFEVDLGTVSFSFTAVSVSFEFNGSTGELWIRPCVNVGFDVCHTFSIGFFGFQPAPPINLAGPQVSAYTQDEYGYWHGAWSGGELFINTGDATEGNRARLRNLNTGEIDENYTIEAMGPMVNGRQTIKVKAFGKEQIFENVERITAVLGSGMDTFTVKPGVKVPVNISGGEGNDKITYLSDAVAVLNGGGGNDIITAAGAAGSVVDGGNGNDIITWVWDQAAVAAVTIRGGGGDNDQFVAKFTDGRDRLILSQPGGVQFRLARLNDSGGELGFVSAESGFEVLRINTLNGNDEFEITNFAPTSLTLLIDVSRYQTGTMTVPLAPGSPDTRTVIIYGLDTSADAVLVRGGVNADSFVLTTPIDSSDFDGDGDTTNRYFRIVRTSAYTLSVLSSTVAGGDTITIDAAGEADTIDASGVSHHLAALTLRGGAGNDTLVGSPFADVLDGGVGDDTYTGGLGTDVYIDDDGYDTLIESRNRDVTITDDTFVVGTVSAASLGGFADVYTVADEVENLAGIFQVIRFTGGAGANSIAVGDVDGLLTINGVSRPTARQFHGVVHLDGAGGGDRYAITIFGDANSVINVFDTGSSGRDYMVVFGADDGAAVDTFLIRANFIAALADTNADQVLDVADRVNFDGSLENSSGTANDAITIRGLAGNDRFISDDAVVRMTLDGGLGRDYFQFGQLFGSDRVSPNVAIGDEIDTTQVDLTPADAPPGTQVIGYLTDGASVPMTVNGGENDDSFVVFRNRAEVTLNGDAGNDSFSVRAFVLATLVVRGGDGDDSIEYASNDLVDIDGGAGIDSVRLLGTQAGDTFVITAAGVSGAGLQVAYINVEALELHAGDGNDTFYILSTAPGFKTQIFGGAGSDRFFIGYDAPAGLGFPTQPHDFSGIAGPLLIEGGPGDPGVFGLSEVVKLPTELNTPLPAGAGTMTDHELPTDVDTLDFDRSSATDDGVGLHSAGTWFDRDQHLPVHTLSGLGMGTGLTIEGQSYPGGVSYRRLEVVEARLGSGSESVSITSIAEDTTLIFRGQGGSDRFLISAAHAPGAVLVVFGDTHASLSHDGAAGDDLIDASTSSAAGIFYGGPGNDIILGSSAADRIAGGSGADILGGGGGDDLIFGDSGFDFDRVAKLTNVRTAGVIGLETFNVAFADVINPGDGNDIVFGDHGRLTQVGGAPNELTLTSLWSVVETTNVNVGGDDLISARADANAAFQTPGAPAVSGGNDLVFGGLGADTVHLGAGNDNLLGDHGRALFAAGMLSRLEATNPTVGGSDTLDAGPGNDRIIGGTAGDVIDGGDGDDVIFGDHGLFDLTQALNVSFISIFTGPLDGGAADVIRAGAGDDIALGQQGDDILLGQDGDDDLIGGHNVAGGIDELEFVTSGNDQIDGGAGNDVIAGDNAVIVRLPGTAGQRFRSIDGTVTPPSSVFTHSPLPTTDIFSSQSPASVLTGRTGPTYLGGTGPDVGPQPRPDPRGVASRHVYLLDHSATAAAGTYGNDMIAGGSGDDMIFGQLGDDRLRGDGAVNTPGPAAFLSASADPAADGDDYIEGNGGSDWIWGDLGRDDLIGGSSSLFGLAAASERPDGVDNIFGGDGTRIARNSDGDTSASGHAADSDFILGDNGNVFRLVAETSPFLTFAYDTYGGSIRLLVRTAEFLDYSPIIGGAGDGDHIRGEDGDDTIHGMTGNDTLYGDGQDDDITGGVGDDWIYGGTGDDGILGDDGLISTARNGLAEPLYGIEATSQQSVNSGANVIVTTIFTPGQLTKYATLPSFTEGGNDVVYGGLGNDFIHGGAGTDALSGAEALTAFYNIEGVRPSLTYSPSLRRFTAFDPGTGLRRIANFFLNFEASIANVRVDDGRDMIFGDNGHDWLVGGTNQDYLFGGMGDDVLNADDNLDTNNGLNHSADSGVYAEPDIAFGGGGLDRLIANTTADRLIDWKDQFNQYLTPFNGVAPTVVRTAPTAGLISALRAIGRAGGADQLLVEPAGELGLVQVSDPEWDDQLGRPANIQTPAVIWLGDSIETIGRQSKRTVDPVIVAIDPGAVMLRP